MSKKNKKIKTSVASQIDINFTRKIHMILEPLEKYFRYEVAGSENIPQKTGCLIVMNHGVIPYHGFLLAKYFFEKLGIAPRGLGADFIFKVPGLREIFSKAGTVNADPKNALRLLRAGCHVFVAPGGIYEALIAKGGLKRIPWERRMGFVRTAVEAKVPIVPTYCQGINHAYYNSYFMLKPRIKLFEKTRFSIPFFMGIGLIPFPVKLIHRIGTPISTKPKRGESKEKLILRLHNEVISSLIELATTHE